MIKTITLSERARLFVEITAFILLAFGSKAILSQVAWRYSGPISLIMLLVILTLYMRRVGLTWEMFGLRRLTGIKPKLMVFPKALLTLVAFAIAVGSVMGLANVFELEFMSEIPAGIEDRWRGIEGNLPLYLLWLGIVWTAAAFGEEMFFRGYLVTRLQQVFSGYVIAPILAVLVAAALFGYGHVYYQGLRGFIMTGAIAIAFGTMFLLFKRNLWPIILVHGFIDTMTFTALFLGLE